MQMSHGRLSPWRQCLAAPDLLFVTDCRADEAYSLNVCWKGTEKDGGRKAGMDCQGAGSIQNTPRGREDFQCRF